MNKPYSEETAREIDAEVKRIVDEQWERTVDLLSQPHNCLTQTLNLFSQYVDLFNQNLDICNQILDLFTQTGLALKNALSNLEH